MTFLKKKVAYNLNSYTTFRKGRGPLKLAIKLLRQPPKWFQEPETKPKSKF